MSERKQSFLERLTGTRTIEDEDRIEGAIYNKEARMQITDPEEEEGDEQDDQEISTDDQLIEEEEESEEPGLAIDIYESDNELVIQSMIAGVTPENLRISITRDTVTIKGKRNAPQGIPDEHYINQELYWGSFSREITLPYEIDTDGAEAVEKYGLLIIRLPKLDIARTQELKVKSVQ